MIITRTPCRLTLRGGGTDLTSYYNRFGGLCSARRSTDTLHLAESPGGRRSDPCQILPLEQVGRVEDIRGTWFD
jgi:D-glycero-alpha-D-manno-heptose-7-phosphate kinase